MHGEVNSDFVVTSYAQNAHIIRAMQQVDIDPIRAVDTTVEGLCRAFRYRHNNNDRSLRRWLSRIEFDIRQLVGLKIAPTNLEGVWIEAAVVLSELLRTPCEQLWPQPLNTVVPYERCNVTEVNIGTDAVWRIM